MALIQSTAIPSSASSYEIDQSIRLDETRNSFLHRTPSSGSNRKTYTISTWLKRSTVQNGSIVVSGADNNYVFRFRFQGGALDAYDYHGGNNSFNWRLTTKAQLRDTAAWYHVLLAFDSTQATNTNRAKMYINGSQVTSFTTESYPSENLSSYINDSEKIWIGETVSEDSAMDGYLADTYFIDGQALSPSDFGKTGDYGEWKPIEYSGSYGTNGYFLNYSNASAFGTDSSGNSNNFTPANLSAHDKMLDTPTNNFAVMNNMRPSCSSAFREGNLYLRDSGSVMGVSTILPETGKWYWEVDPQDRYAGSPQYGIATETINNETEVGGSLDGVKIVAYSGGNDISLHGTGTLHGSTGPWPSDHIWGFALDNDNGKLWISRDGDWTHVLSGGNPSTATNPTASGLPTGYPIFGNIGSASTTFNAYIRVNFGADGTFFGNQTSGGYSDDNGYGDFKYEVPTGFLSLCAKNLPEPDVVPSEHFNTVLYTGNEATQSITNVSFQPNLVWFKQRDGTRNHTLIDSVRGGTKQLFPNSTGTEETYSTAITSFDTDGFTIGSQYNINEDNKSMVAWNWKANGSGSSNTDGSITSTVSANVDSGFSIVSFSGNQTAGATVGHGLSKAPEMIITKSRAGTTGWLVGHNSLPDWSYGLAFNTTAATWSENPLWNSTAPDATKFTLGSDTFGNSSNTRIAYCFHSVDGYSAVGSYIGNDNADGTFVYTGFRVAFLLLKNTAVSGEGFVIINNKSDPNNPTGTYLEVYGSSAEQGTAGTTFSRSIDFLSNGFKLRGNSTEVNDGETMVYYAIAETPFKYSNAR